MMYHLPDDIIYHIGKFVREIDFVWSSKTKYQSNHNFYIQEHWVNKSLRESYIRMVIRNDYYIILGQLLLDFGVFWVTTKKERFEIYVFSNFMELLIFLTEKYESTRCNNTITIFLKKNKLYVNRHKKTKRRNIKWKG